MQAFNANLPGLFFLLFFFWHSQLGILKLFIRCVYDDILDKRGQYRRYCTVQSVLFKCIYRRNIALSDDESVMYLMRDRLGGTQGTVCKCFPPLFYSSIRMNQSTVSQVWSISQMQIQMQMPMLIYTNAYRVSSRSKLSPPALNM